MQLITDKRAENFIEGLSDTEKGRVLRYLDLFEKYGFSLPGEYLKKLSPNLWELRPGDIRLLLGFSSWRKSAIVVHGFRKKTQKTPKREIQTGIIRLKEYQA